MQERTVARLLALNEQFYQTFGKEFSSTRQRLQAGVLRIIDTLDREVTILDLGCGNGELARALARRAHRGAYLGVDLSHPLLQAAGSTQAPAHQAFIQADLVSPGWEAAIPPSFPAQFDLVTAFAVLHHIPGGHTRLELLKRVHALLRPGRRFIHSEWQFLSSERLLRRLQPWELAGLSADDVDPGDYLLDWRSGGHGLRYAHHFSETELAGLAAAAGFSILETFYSDGSNGHLSLYQTWEKKA